MDLLSDLFREAGLRRRFLNLHALPEGPALRFPCDRSVGFHVVLAGPVWVHSPTLPAPLRLEDGDIAVMGRGCDHVLAASDDLTGVSVATIPMSADRRASVDGAVTVASGAYQLWNTPVHPFFAELPSWFVLRADRGEALASLRTTVATLEDELRRDSLGRETVVVALLDVLFAFLVREIVARRGDERAGWSHAVRDPQVRRAVAAMHADCARDWTLEALARSAGVSRSVLAERFREAMGETPLAYLRTVRLQRAMRLLSEGDHTLEQIASAVGYGDAFAFSKAFKRRVGMSPGEFRRSDAEGRGLPWRFAEAEAVNV